MDRVSALCSRVLHARRVTHPTATAIFLLALGISNRALGAQYTNTHSGHPGRVEDASPIGKRSVDVDLFGVRLERLEGGITRTRLDPGITWGALPQTEVGVRLPVVWLDVPGSRIRTAGVAGVAVRVMHAFNLETPGVPAFGLSTEALLPAGGLAAPGTSYLVKAMASKRSARGRWHVNVGGGAYSVRTSVVAAADSLCADGTSGCAGPPIIIDLPCYVGPSGDATLRIASPMPEPVVRDPGIRVNRMCMPSNAAHTTAQRAVPTAPKGSGARWMIGAGVDRPIALKSLLLSANVLVERFEGLYAQADAYAESGVRWQASPRTVVDAGVSWRFAGAIRSLSLTLGTSIEVALPLLVRRPAP
jgi:hypothetical protein